MSLHFSKTANLNKIQEVIREGCQPLYGLFNREAVGEILSSAVLENTPYRGGVSKRSLRIRIKPKAEDRGEDLAGIFGLDAEVFGKKYLKTEKEGYTKYWDSILKQKDSEGIDAEDNPSE